MSLERESDHRRQNIPTGSPGKDEPVFLAVGRLRHAHGVKGEISMDVLTDFPERLSNGKVVYMGDEHLPLTITSVRGKNQLLLLSFDGYGDCDLVNQFRNQLLYVCAENLPPLPEGEYYFHQLQGLNVVDEAGVRLGILDEILETGANDVYVVHSSDGKEILLPVIASVVLKVDLEKGEMVVHPPEWE